jgi:hypothetical protein
MKMASSVAAAAALALIAGSYSAPADAQKKGKQEKGKQAAAAPAQPAGWTAKLSKPEAVALQAVDKAIAAKDWAAASTALAAAQPIATSPDARYFIGQYQYSIGIGTANQQLQLQGVDAMAASGGGDPTRMAPLFKVQWQQAVQAKDWAKAEAANARWAQLAPNDPELPLATAEMKFRQNKPAEAYPLFQRVISTQEAAGQTVGEPLYLFALQSAANAKMWPQALTVSKTLIQKYPNQKNWRNALLIFRQSSSGESASQLDTLRLMRAAKSLDTRDEYLALADLLARGRFYSEAKTVIEEGYASGKLPRGTADATAILTEVNARIAPDRAALPPLESRARSGANGEFALKIAEGYYGHGDYAKAAELYRMALQKGGVESNLVNTRLGMALALGGQKAEAQAAFKAVGGARTALASYWLLWLSQRA